MRVTRQLAADPHCSRRSTRSSMLTLANEDVLANEQKQQQDALDALMDKLAPRKKKTLLSKKDKKSKNSLEDLQRFLAGDAAQQDKLEQLVNFLADEPADQPQHEELAAQTDVFADEQKQQQQQLDKLVDSLANVKTELLATDTDDVDAVHAQVSLLSLMGGAVLLLVAVALLVLKRSPGKLIKLKKEEDNHKDFGYTVMYE